MYQLVVCNISIMAIAMIYYTWQDARRSRVRKQGELNERVAQMLWAAAQRGG